MKKIVLLLVVIVIGTTAFAAAPKTAPMAMDNRGGLAIGTALGFPTLQYSFNRDMTGQLGASYASGGGASSTAYLIKVDYNLQKVGEVQSNMGLFYSSNGAAAATTVLGLTYGLSTKVAANFSLGADFILFNSLSAGATTTTGILGIGAVGASVVGLTSGVNLSASYTL
ncbi:hypothetical protein HZB07_05255 [Candidatus Saganbacteria bacterium]|nr:hypothetical protein [Candidatus Saganbacteria bacterium]